MKKSIVILGVFFSSLAYVQAQTATPKVSDKQKNQTVRIKEGVRTGELTRGEAAAMAKDQKELKRMKRRTKVDGVVTRKERALLHKKANSNSKKIYRQKND